MLRGISKLNEAEEEEEGETYTVRTFIIFSIYYMLLKSLDLRECSKDSAWKQQE
jgi:hypothetical protein